MPPPTDMRPLLSRNYSSDSAGRLRPATPTKQKAQHKPRQESTNVRHVSDATLRCAGNGTDAAKKLQHEPDPNDLSARALELPVGPAIL